MERWCAIFPCGSCFPAARQAPYKTNNFFLCRLERQNHLDKEVHRIVCGNHRQARRLFGRKETAGKPAPARQTDGYRVRSGQQLRCHRPDQSGNGEGSVRQDSNPPYPADVPDGICRVDRYLLHKLWQLQDINLQLSRKMTKPPIFEGWRTSSTSFDSSVHVQICAGPVPAHDSAPVHNRHSPLKGDFNDVRAGSPASAPVLPRAAAPTKTKYLNFGIEAENIPDRKAGGAVLRRAVF